MKELICDLEKAVEQAALSEEWSDDLQSHATVCLLCQEVVLVSKYLQSLTGEPDIVLPAAAQVWWKAQLREKQTKYARAARLVAFARRLTLVITHTAIVIWITYEWSEIYDAISLYFDTAASQSRYALASNLEPLIYLIMILMGINVALTLRAVWKERKSRADCRRA